MKKLPKEWIGNVGYSILGNTFSNWVKDQIEARNQKLQVQGSMHIELDPDVAAAFQASTAVSRKYHQPISSVFLSPADIFFLIS
jgi:hypothetical protein